MRVDIGREDPLVSHDLGHVLALESSTPPDDAAEADLARKRNWFVVMDDTAGEEAAAPVSGSGYLEWQGFLGDMGTLTAVAHRRSGFGFTAARLATNDAIDSGLVPQWRSNIDNIAGRLLGQALGYEEIGIHTSVELTRMLEV